VDLKTFWRKPRPPKEKGLSICGSEAKNVLEEMKTPKEMRPSIVEVTLKTFQKKHRR
jgi:hypothetical protein